MAGLLVFVLLLRFVFIKPEIFSDLPPAFDTPSPAITLTPGTTSENISDRILQVNSKSGDTCRSFTLIYPSNWTLKTTERDYPQYTLSLLDASLIIDRNPGKISICIFPDTDTSKPRENLQASQLIKTYETIPFQNGTFRRYHQNGYDPSDEIICEKQPTADFYLIPAQTGFITYRKSKSDPELNRVLDRILGSIRYK